MVETWFLVEYGEETDLKMAEVQTLKKEPNQLYDLCLDSLVNYVINKWCYINEIRVLPDSILMDVYFKVRFEFLYICVEPI